MAALMTWCNVPSTLLTAATPQTAIQIIAPTNQRLRVLGFGFFLDGTSNSAQPAQVRVLRQTTAGTASAGTVKLNEKELTETVQATTQITFSGEPTAGDVLRTFTIHPQLGYETMLPLGQEIVIQGGGRLGFEVTAPAGVNVRGHVTLEE